MNIIKQNPFRVLGLPCNSTEKELQKQIGLIKRYAEVGKSKSFDFDFEIIGDLKRNVDKIQEASNKIEQSHKKLLYSLFWFIRKTQVDTEAFNSLREKEIDKTIANWNITLKEGVTIENFSSYHNISTLYIALSIITEQINLYYLQLGILLKGNLIHSDFFKDFTFHVTGAETKINIIDLDEKFVDEIIELLKPFINKNNGISINKIVSLFHTFPSSTQNYLSLKFISSPILNIETKIDETKIKRNDIQRYADKHGEELYLSTKKDIVLLKEILKPSSLQFQTIANKLAKEILQCAIDYFNYYRDTDNSIDPGSNALKVARFAKSVNPNGHVLEKIIKSIETIQEWVNDEPIRNRQQVASNDILFITNQLLDFKNKSNSLKNAKELMQSCKSTLSQIKIKLGGQDSVYLELSTAVAGNVQSMIVSEVNSALAERNRYVEYLNDRHDPFKMTSRIPSLSQRHIFNNIIPTEYPLEKLKAVLKEAWALTKLVGNMDMFHEQKENYLTNRDDLKSLLEKVGVPTNIGQVIDKGCYIATMAYGDIDHPQVIVLREFRDRKLKTSLIGRSFIRIYYATSPHFVNLLQNKKEINSVIRKILDKLINKVK